MMYQPTDYRRWEQIDYRPAIAYLPASALIQLLQPGSRVLEVGSGSGEISRDLARAGMAVEALDLNAEAMSKATAAAAAEKLDQSISFRNTDFLSTAVGTRFDAVVLVRVLTCLPDEADWKLMLARSRSALKDGGLLYVHDFVMVCADKHYARRYLNGRDRGWRPGAFAVPAPPSNLEFVAYHHDDEAIAEIARPYQTVSLTFHESRSMTGNPVRMFEFIGKLRDTRKLPKDDSQCE